ncbi:MAG: hypothetical protein JO288_01695 [Hyphomicrobiales bacterium]|nr:hypothetical protein [Hyphomicrobiales bacterium]
MEFYRIWRILLAYKRLLIWLPAAATLAGLGLAYVLPEKYASTALVVVRPAEEIKFDANSGDQKEVMEFPVSRSAPLDAPSKTYMEEIKSAAVAVRIVEALHLDIRLPKEGRSQFEVIKDELRDWLVAAIRTIRNYARYGRDIPASPFELAVENVEQNLDVSVRKDTYAFDITFASSNPNEAAAVANMAAQIFIDHSSEAYRREARRAREFIESQLDESRKALEQARAAVLSYKNSGQTFDLESEYKEKLRGLTELEDALVKGEGKLAGLQQTFRPDSPEIQAQKAEITALQERIAALQAPLVGYPEKEAQLNAITLAERLADERYELIQKRFEEARIKESAVVAEIRIVSPAEPALYPVKPLKYLYGGLSFITALIAAVGWALFLEQLRPRVRTIRDLDSLGDTTVLGAIPKMRPSMWRAGE